MPRRAIGAKPKATVDKGETYEIQFIFQSRILHEKEEFQVFWRGYPEDEATWETEDTLKECPGFKRALDDFRSEEKKRKEAHQLYLKQRTANELVVDRKKKLPNGFDRGLKVEKIFGASKCDDGGMVYLVKWADTDEADNVRGKLLMEHCPEQLAEYLRSRLVFKKAGGAVADKQDGEKSTD